MKLGYLKQFITYTFIALFLCVKAAGLHALTHKHNDTTKHCKVCITISSNNFTPLITNFIAYTIDSDDKFHSLQQVIANYCHHYTTIRGNIHLFSRPPPL